MNEAEILELIKGILNTMEEQGKLIKTMIDNNLALKKRVEKLEGDE